MEGAGRARDVGEGLFTPGGRRPAAHHVVRKKQRFGNRLSEARAAALWAPPLPAPRRHGPSPRGGRARACALGTQCLRRLPARLL